MEVEEETSQGEGMGDGGGRKVGRFGCRRPFDQLFNRDAVSGRSKGGVQGAGAN